MKRKAHNQPLIEDTFEEMQAYKQQPYRRHKVRLDGYDVTYILTAFDSDERLQREAL